MLNKHKCSSAMMGWQCTTAECYEFITERTDSPIEILQHFFASFFGCFLILGIPFILWMTAFESALHYRFTPPSLANILLSVYACATMAFIYINHHIVDGTLTFTIPTWEIEELADQAEVCIAFPENPLIVF